MTCHRLPNGWRICAANLYEWEFDGVVYLFEFHHYFGPARLRKRDREPWALPPGKGFWRMVEAWLKLAEDEREKCRVN